jgi:hypothetical protein
MLKNENGAAAGHLHTPINNKRILKANRLFVKPERGQA